MAHALKLSMALAAMLVATPAYAVTVATNTTVPTPLGLLDLPTDDLNFQGNLTLSDLDGTAPNARSPWEGTIHYGAEFHSVSANGYAEYDFFGVDQTGLSLMWGSPDSYNLLSFYNDGNVLPVFTIAGSLVGPPFGSGFVNVIIGDIIFDLVRFESFGADAFEYAFDSATNVTPQVPLPAGLLLLLTGLGGLGFLGRARAKAA